MAIIFRLDALYVKVGFTGRLPNRERRTREYLTPAEAKWLIKRGVPSTHPLRGVELRALRRVQRDYPPSPYVFSSERPGPSPPRRSGSSQRERAGWRGSASRSTRTCCAAPAASSCPTTARTRAPSSTTSGTRTFSTASGARNSRRTGSRGSRGIRRPPKSRKDSFGPWR